MKTKLQILVFLILLSSLIVAPSVHLNAADELDMPVLSFEDNELPSTSFYKREKRSIVGTTQSSAIISPLNGLMSAGEWDVDILTKIGQKVKRYFSSFVFCIVH